MEEVNICGIPHRIVECEDKFDIDLHLGQIEFASAEIKINASLKGKLREATICHEMLHGILTHLGYYELSNDECFVQSVSNAIMQGFVIKKEETKTPKSLD